MSYARYLTAINSMLLQAVLPEIQSGRAKDGLNNCISALAGIAAQLERVAPEALGAIDVSALPEVLRTLAPTAALPEAVAGSALTLALSNPVDDFATNHEAFPLLKAGAAWLKSQPWPNDAALMKSAVALLSWETAMRGDTLARVHAAEQGFAEVVGAAGVPDLNQPALEAYLRKRFGSNDIRVTEFRFLAGGRNRQTALFAIEGTTEIPSRLVIQREPPTQMTTFNGVGMQFAVLQQAYAAGMKVARPVLVELSAEELGGTFMITEQVKGTSPVPSMDYWSLPVKSDKLPASLAAQFALLHNIPIDPLEGAVERYIDPGKGQTWLSDLELLEQQLESVAQAPSMAVTAALAWMRAHVGCVDAVETIVHNDALLHNTLAENEEITAVLDFEMAHIGHPFEDLGYVRPVIEQMTDWSRFIDAYVAAGGRRPTQEQIDFFTLRSILKLQIQVMYVRGAFDSGKANVPALAEIGASFLPKLIDRLATQLNGILQS